MSCYSKVIYIIVDLSNPEVRNMVNLGIVVSEFNFEVTYVMLELAKEHAEFLGAKVKSVFKVPGAFDMPLAVKTLVEKGDIDGVVTLGSVIEGETKHDEIVIQHASRKIADLSLEYDKPISLGISGPGLTRLEALERVDYSKRAVESVVKMVKRLKKTSG
jgi:6,7-dimethyl-8-ribityllumazine synthase